MVFFTVNKIFLSKPCSISTYISIVRMLKKIGILILITGLCACSTKRNTWLSRNYNQLTARYNILYNGTESFKSGEKTLMEGQRDNYTGILPLFPYSGANRAGVVSGDMNVAIEKGLKLIKEKSIKVKPKQKPDRDNVAQNKFYNRREFNRWVDEAYILVGKAHLYNHEFIEAVQYFEFILREFPDHPVTFEAIIWLARTRIEMGDQETALLLLNQYDAMGKAPNKLYGEFMATYADYLIHIGQFNAAIPFMVTATDQAQGKWHKTRRNYILGQLYQQSGQCHLAHERFSKVVKANPDYEMNLNARLNLAIINGHLEGDNQSTRQDLTRLLKQSKNQEFRDRIYYILAQSYLNEGDTLSAITNLRLSAGYNQGNQELKTETFIKLGQLYFEDEQYVPAYAYHDSTLLVLNDQDPRFRDIRSRHSGLKDLSAHYAIINHQDSVRRIAALPADERDAFIDKLMEQQSLEQAQAQQNEGLMGGGLADDPMFYKNYSNQLSGQTSTQGQWYFYNPTTASLGKMDFEKRWGRRASEDNWRRSDKGTAAPTQDFAPPGSPEEGFVSESVVPGSEFPGQPGSETGSLPSREELLAGLPLTPEMMTLSDDLLAKAHFDAGMVFYDEFKDYRKAANMFRVVATKYGTHQLAEQAWFWAFRSYSKLDHAAGMDEMRTGLITHFPNSRYTAFVTEIDYQEKQARKEAAIILNYEEAYSGYLTGNYQQTITKTAAVLSATEKKELTRKSHLLKAIAHGKSGNYPAFEVELKLLAEQHAETSEGMLAAKWLEMLTQGRRPVSDPMRPGGPIVGDSAMQVTDAPTEALVFNFEPGATHFLLLVVNSETDINRLLFNLADYNFNRFLLGDYEFDNKLLPNGQRLITIGLFNNSREVMDYFYALREKENVFRVGNIGVPSIFAGSESNVKLLVSSGDVNAFRNFFSLNYLSGSTGTTINPSSVSSPQQAPLQEVSPFKASADAHMGMVILTSNVDRNQMTTFLTNHALNNLRKRITLKFETLAKGETVLLIETFENPDASDRFFKSLETIYFWNTQLGARNWQKMAISSSNFEVVKTEGSTQNYVTFYSDNYLKK
jgi:outer membrane protein assembly factor BamD (BamD/ComL family)